MLNSAIWTLVAVLGLFIWAGIFLVWPDRNITEKLRKKYRQPPPDPAKETVVMVGGLPPLEWRMDFLHYFIGDEYRFIFVNPFACRQLADAGPEIDRINQGVIKFLRAHKVAEIDYLIPYSAGCGFIRDLIMDPHFRIRHLRPLNPVGLCRFSAPTYICRLLIMVALGLTRHQTRRMTKIVVWETWLAFVKHRRTYLAITKEVIFNFDQGIWDIATKQLDTRFCVANRDILFPIKEMISSIEKLGADFCVSSEEGHFSILEAPESACNPIK